MNFYIVDSNAAPDVKLISDMGRKGYRAIVFDFIKSEIIGHSVKKSARKKSNSNAYIKTKGNIELFNTLQSHLDNGLKFITCKNTFSEIWQNCVDGLDKSIIKAMLRSYIEDFDVAKSLRVTNKSMQSRYNIILGVLNDISAWLRVDMEINVQNYHQIEDVIFEQDASIYESFKSNFFALSLSEIGDKTFAVHHKKVHSNLDVNDMSLILRAYHFCCPLLTKNMAMASQVYGSFATYVFAHQVLFLNANEDASSTINAFSQKKDHNYYRLECNHGAINSEATDVPKSPCNNTCALQPHSDQKRVNPANKISDRGSVSETKKRKRSDSSRLPNKSVKDDEAEAYSSLIDNICFLNTSPSRDGNKENDSSPINELNDANASTSLLDFHNNY